MIKHIVKDHVSVHLFTTNHTTDQARGHNSKEKFNSNNLHLVESKVDEKTNKTQEPIPSTAANRKTFQENNNNLTFKDEDGALWNLRFRSWFQLPRL